MPKSKSTLVGAMSRLSSDEKTNHMAQVNAKNRAAADRYEESRKANKGPTKNMAPYAAMVRAEKRSKRTW